MHYKLSDILILLRFGVTFVGVATGLGFDLVEFVDVWTEKAFFGLGPVIHFMDFDDDVTMSFGSFYFWSAPCTGQSSLRVTVLARGLLLTFGTFSAQGKDQFTVKSEWQDWNM